MRNRLLGALAAGSLLFLLPAGAAAQTEDPCYVDPTSEECIDVGGADGEADDGDDGQDDGEVGADDGEVGADDGTEVRGESLGVGGAAATGALPRTGLEIGVTVGLVVGLLAAGAALLLMTRRRRTN